MKKCMFIVSPLLLLFLGISCGVGNGEVSRESRTYQLLEDEIMTRMPGSLLIAGDYLVWEDPFSREYFLQVHNIQDGQPIGVMGKVGEGPREFITGGITGACVNNRFFAIDANGKTTGYLSIDSLLQGRDPFIPLTDIDKKTRPTMSEYAHQVFISRTEDGEENYFRCNINGKESAFGVYPVKEVKQHVGGTMSYDSISGYLAYSSFNLPYLSLYKRKGNTFELQWEREPNKQQYDVVNDAIVFDRKIGGIMGSCLTKDYIVTLERDRETDFTDESKVGRDASKCPHTVFLYDYKSNLVKIIDLGIPVIRIAADRTSNTLYAIGVNPDYILVKYEL